MPNNDVLPYSANEDEITPDADEVVSVGVTPAKQATRMGLTVIASEPGATPNGIYSVVIETAVAGDSADADWHQNSNDRIDGISEEGSYHMFLTEPVLDKVRARIITDAANPERLAFDLIWGCDTELTLNS